MRPHQRTADSLAMALDLDRRRTCPINIKQQDDIHETFHERPLCGNRHDAPGHP